MGRKSTHPHQWDTLRKWRDSNKISQEALSASLGITQDTVSRWECMDTPPYWKHLHKLSELMQVPLPTLAQEVATAVAEKKYRSHA